jgi:hypothetical protein
MIFADWRLICVCKYTYVCRSVLRAKVIYINKKIKISREMIDREIILLLLFCCNYGPHSPIFSCFTPFHCLNIETFLLFSITHILFMLSPNLIIFDVKGRTQVQNLKLFKSKLVRRAKNSLKIGKRTTHQVT